jgi:hypothetical protein
MQQNKVEKQEMKQVKEHHDEMSDKDHKEKYLKDMK